MKCRERSSVRRRSLVAGLLFFSLACTAQGQQKTLASPKKKAWTERVVAPAAKKFWSFEPLRKPSEAVATIDRFVQVGQQTAGIAGNPPATRQQLIRRAFFDLIGLPPTPEEVQAFLDDPAADAFDKLVERLLASPHYGERWARHWLDLARFAESHGFEHDSDRPTAYHYRDFVIEALNRDLPYDTFVKWQVAGDEYAPENPLALKATGFLAAGVHSTQITKAEVAKHRYDEMDDKLNTLGTAMLGLSIGCARCHDHKFDPIPQSDYYRLLSTFTTTVRSEVVVNLDAVNYKKAKEAFDRAHAPYEEALRQCQVPAPLAVPAGKRTKSALDWNRRLDPEWQKLNRQRLEHLARAPKPNTVKCLIATEGLPAVRLHTQGEDFLPVTHFLRRGDAENKEGEATQSFLQVLMPAPDAAPRWQAPPPAGGRTSYRRRALAEWLTDTQAGAGNLLARVIVNRLWQHHFGRGLVATPSDFGTRGERPSHPELLDFLAGQLIAEGWRLKPIHKLIMTSAAYMQTSQTDEARLKLDRDNKLCWHYPGRRLEAEVIRDAVLAVSGQLDAKMYGPGTLDPASKRRSIYFTVKRSKLVPMMVIFDAPEALGGMAERPTTTIAPQALHLLNSPQMRDAARSFARRFAAVPLDAVVRTGYQAALARLPSREELQDGVAFIEQQQASYPGPQPREAALTDFCQVLLCLNEFVYVE
jgi:hypothetical protein